MGRRNWRFIFVLGFKNKMIQHNETSVVMILIGDKNNQKLT